MKIEITTKIESYRSIVVDVPEDKLAVIESMVAESPAAIGDVTVYVVEPEPFDDWDDPTVEAAILDEEEHHRADFAFAEFELAYTNAKTRIAEDKVMRQKEEHDASEEVQA